jgi:hypothetical protein
MLEDAIERHFCRQVKRLGGVTVKMTPQGVSGWPDRLAILPGGRAMLVELKRPKSKGRRKGQLSPKQRIVLHLLQTLGMEAWHASTKEEIDERLFRGAAPQAAQTLRGALRTAGQGTDAGDRGADDLQDRLPARGRRRREP